jgi:hypothetical protein
MCELRVTHTIGLTFFSRQNPKVVDVSCAKVQDAHSFVTLADHGHAHIFEYSSDGSLLSFEVLDTGQDHAVGVSHCVSGR